MTLIRNVELPCVGGGRHAQFENLLNLICEISRKETRKLSLS